MIGEIYNRRSVRKFKEIPVPRKMVEQVIEAGINAPSAKNRQPWKFIVISGSEKDKMLEAMKKGIAKEECGQGFLKNSRQHIGGAKYTVKAMEQAPVILFVLNELGSSLAVSLTAEEIIYDRANIQSIGAAIQNMLLEAENIGLNTLWICDICFAYDELNQYLGESGEMVAAIALGYGDEKPAKRPRKALEEVVQWRE